MKVPYQVYECVSQRRANMQAVIEKQYPTQGLSTLLERSRLALGDQDFEMLQNFLQAEGKLTAFESLIFEDFEPPDEEG